MTTPAEVHDRWVQSVPTREPRQPQLQVAVHQDPMEPQSLVLEGNDKMELGIKLRENKAYRLAEQHKHAPAQETEEYEYVNLNTICTVDAY